MRTVSWMPQRRFRWALARCMLMRRVLRALQTMAESGLCLPVGCS